MDKNTKYRIGSFLFFPVLKLLKSGQRTLKLSEKQNALLLLLYEKRNKYLSRNEALRKIWENDSFYTARSMDVYICALRQKLKDDPEVRIMTKRDTGHMLVVPSALDDE